MKILVTTTSMMLSTLVSANAYTLWIMHCDSSEKCFDACNCTFDDFGNPDIVPGAMGAGLIS